MDYKQTLLLPTTSFPMRANLGQKEPEWILAWKKQDLYGLLRAARQHAPLFWLHDGPPYANGKLHHGHMLNKILKDMVIKDRTMAGMNAPYVPGWDCHGLPIETQVEKNAGAEAAKWSKVERHAHCAAYATQWIATQRETFERLGIFGQFDAPYLTMNKSYQAGILQVFSKLVAKQLIYRGLRPVHWCPTHQTALAEAEVIYQEKPTPSAYVLFPLQAASLANLALPPKTAMLVWTTTPWTLPGNQALAVDSQATYQLVQTRLGPCLIAQACVAACQQEADLGPLSPLGEQVWLGEQLVGQKVSHPLFDSPRAIYAADFVTLDTGTGCVHIAPAHGEEDFQLGKVHGLSLSSLLDSKGHMVPAAQFGVGLFYKQVNPLVLEQLAARNLLLSDKGKQVNHRASHCWRCQQPLLFQATKQWFVDLDKPLAPSALSLRQQALARIEQVSWTPSWGANRIGSMLANRPDWCISRQRTWGVPIAVAICSHCDTPILVPAILEQIAAQFAELGAQSWFAGQGQALYAGQSCPKCSSTELLFETDILDVWFDSGASFFASALQEQTGALADAVASPGFQVADLIIEGSDQHRGWFHSSLLLAQASFEQAPYKQVLTHGFVVDGQGKKLSKSAGNGIDPYQTLKQDGADILRLWVASLDFRDDVRLSEEIFTRQREAYRKLRNTLRFLLGVLHDFVPEQHLVSPSACLPLERCSLIYLMHHGAIIQQSMAQYRFHEAIAWLVDYCSTDLSAFLCDILKDRLYASPQASVERRSGQTVLWWIARDILRWLAPVLSFTTEEAWQLLPKLSQDSSSVHLQLYPEQEQLALRAPWRQLLSEQGDGLLAEYQHLLAIRAESNKVLEQARQQGVLRTSSQAQLQLTVPAAMHTALAPWQPAMLAELCQVAHVDWQAGKAEQKAIEVVCSVPTTIKCPRCWRHRLPSSQESANLLCQRCEEALP